MSHYTPTGKALLENGDVLDTTIDQLIGQGLSYDDWKTELENVGGFAWSESVKNVIIKREFSFFKEEILRLQSEPNTTPGLKSKTNSLESILKRLQGLEWVRGVPDEMEERKRDGRLLGRDAKARCLQYHVSRWKNEASSPIQTPSSGSSNRKAIEATPDPKLSESIFSKLARPAPAAAATSPLTNVSNETPSKNDTCCDTNSFSFQNTSDVSTSDTSSIFGHTAQAPASDPTLLGDREIPWVPHTHGYEIGADVADITLEDFFHFIEQEPNFPAEPRCEIPYFELPRGDGINDSCETYVAETRKDPNTHGMILEEIIDHYGTESRKGIWLSNLTQEITHLVEGSQFDQTICAGNTTFSERDLGISQSEPSQNECRSITQSDDFCRSFDAETLALGATSSSESYRQDDQETGIHQLQSQNTASAVIESTATFSSDKDLSPQDDPLFHIQAELCKKRQELAAAEIRVSKLSTEVKLLEERFAKRRSNHPRENTFTTTPKSKTSHKRNNEEALRSAKRQKGKAAAPNLELENFITNREREVCYLPNRQISALKTPTPTTIDGKEGRSAQCLAQDNDTIASNHAVVTVRGNSEDPEPYFTYEVQNSGDCAPRSDTRENPTLYQHLNTSDATQSLSTRTPWSDLVSWGESDVTLTNDLGLGAVSNGLLNCRASSVGVIEDVDERIAWVA